MSEIIDVTPEMFLAISKGLLAASKFQKRLPHDPTPEAIDKTYVLEYAQILLDGEKFEADDIAAGFTAHLRKDPWFPRPSEVLPGARSAKSDRLHREMNERFRAEAKRVEETPALEATVSFDVKARFQDLANRRRMPVERNSEEDVASRVEAMRRAMQKQP